MGKCSRLLGLSSLLLSFGCIPEGDSVDAVPGNSKVQPQPKELSKALAALDIRAGGHFHLNAFEPNGPDRSFLRFDLLQDCPEAIDRLTRTPFDVDADLLRIARSNKPLPARYRAVYILAQRKNRAVLPILERMCAAENADERLVAWYVFTDAIRDKRLPPSSDASSVLARWKLEKDYLVSRYMVEYLGAVQCKEAVPIFLARLRTGSDPDL
jgi:hypothetical protein